MSKFEYHYAIDDDQCDYDDALVYKSMTDYTGADDCELEILAKECLKHWHTRYADYGFADGQTFDVFVWLDKDTKQHYTAYIELEPVYYVRKAT